MSGHYIIDMPKAQMRRYAEAWEGLPMPRLQLRWAPKPVPASDKKRASDIRRQKRLCKDMKLPYEPDLAWDCFYEMILPAPNHTRDERYQVGFIIVPISFTRRGSSRPPCQGSPTDDPWRDGCHAFWDSKALGWLPIYVVAPDGTATQRTGFIDEPPHWRSITSARAAMEAR